MQQASSIAAPRRAPAAGDRVSAPSVTPEWAAVGTLVILLLALLTQVLIKTSGFLVYSLDDPYIHIAMAERLVGGHYGINAGEVTSPSSSVIWPFLLLPTAGTPFGLYMPMALNILFALTTAYVLGRFAAEIGMPTDWKYADAARLAIGALLVIATNLVGLAFIGLEHNLQVMIAVVAAWSMLVHARGGDLSRWVLVLAALGPAVRYEMFAITAAVCLVLAMERRWRDMIVVGAGSLILPAALAMFLLAHGNFPLPNSVMAKLGSGSAVGSGGIVQALLGGSGALSAYFHNSFGAKLAMIASIGIMAWALTQSAGRLRAVFAAGVLVGVLHMTAGQFGWFFRYEIYALAFCGMIAISAVSARAPLIPVVGLMATAWCYLPALVMTPGGAANIYEQQYQMHRFVREHYPKPFAVLDIGWVSVGRGGDGSVVDLLGLASNEAVRQRDKSAEWLDDVTRRHDAGLAMIYVEAFKRIPGSWTKVGELKLASRRMTASYSSVGIYATAVGDRHEIARRLAAFKPTLPDGVQLVID
jgi:hypothetical protein